MNDLIDSEAKIKEAELYHSMGLLSESLDTYELIISGEGDLDSEQKGSIAGQIEKIKKEMSDLQEKVSADLSTEDLSLIKETLVIDENAPAIRDSAFAFKELGLFGEAVSEYEKLFQLDYPHEEVITEVADCFLHIESPSNLVERVDKILGKNGLDAGRKARISHGFGLEMEKRNYSDLALALYRTANKLDPDNSEVNERLESIKATQSQGSKYDYLLDGGKVNTEQLQQALIIAKRQKKSVEFALIEHLKIEKEDVGKSLSLYFGVPFKAFDPDIDTPVELITHLKKSFLLQDLWVPINWDKDLVEILVDDPRDLNKTDHIKALVKARKINFYVGIREDIESFIKNFFSSKQAHDVPQASIDDFDVIPDISFEEEEDIYEDPDELDEASGQVVKLVDQVLVAAYRKNASDIHIEPSPENRTTSIRFRMDGVCQEYLQVPNAMARGILSRLKIISELDIAERRLPQDGKIKFKRKGVPPFELRMATLPTAGGFEDAVLRILAKSGAMPLDDMGLSERNFEVMQHIITQPYGLVLVVGPTGSGKTTSLHAALGYINKPGIKIWTAEDPVEITQPGLRQVEAKPKIGLDFSRIMRAFLRADPDVIMIGEMRDHETAAIGVEASLTGHLVFSTLHTNSAPETITRLLDMGLNPLNFSDAFLGVLAQRLVRRLCTSCREEYHPSDEEFEEIVSDFGEEHFEKTGIQNSSDFLIYRPTGCPACSGTGYKGRAGIHELMGGSAVIKKMIKKQASSEELFLQAIEEGMFTLKQDAILKAFQGLTDISEVRRVCIN